MTFRYSFFKNSLYKWRRAHLYLFLTKNVICSIFYGIIFKRWFFMVCSILSWQLDVKPFSFFHNCRRVRSGSGISVITSTSVDQRLPEEPVLEDEQQQLEKKLPGKTVFILEFYSLLEIFCL